MVWSMRYGFYLPTRGKTATPEALERVRQALGLNKPLIEQYLAYITGIVRLDLGHSFITNRDVTDDFLQRFPATIELTDPAYRADLSNWVNRPPSQRDGVPIDTTVPPAARPVPVRDFTGTAPEAATLHDRVELADTHARYAVLFTDADEPRDWIAAGEALSAVLLTATAEGLATSMMSDLVSGRSLFRMRNSSSAYSFGLRSTAAPARRTVRRIVSISRSATRSTLSRGVPRRSSARSRAESSARANGFAM